MSISLTIDGRLSQGQWSNLITEWNRLTSWERSARAAECKARGHQWMDTPLSDDTGTTLVCCRCLKYDTGA